MFKILIVDDDRDFSKALETFLSRNGYEVCYAYDAEKAYDAIYKNVFDLIISDIMMPGTDGFQFATLARNEAQYSSSSKFTFRPLL